MGLHSRVETTMTDVGTPPAAANATIEATTDRREFARFIAPLQADPASHMGMTGIEEDAIVKDLEEYGTALFVERDPAGSVLGAGGFDYDEPLRRGFLYGPWSVDTGWNERAGRLFDKVVQELPGDASEIHMASGVDNVRAEAFARERGFELVRDHFTMVFDRDQRDLRPDPEIRELKAEDRPAVMALHERCFENIWPSGEQLMELLEKTPDRRIFVIDIDGRVAGYHYAVVERSTGEAFVENIGTDDAVRGRGLATRLLAHGL